MVLTKSERAAMDHPDTLGAGAKKRKKLSSGAAKRKVVMAEFERGTLHSGSGQIVTNPKQAVAISYSEAEKHSQKKHMTANPHNKIRM